MLVNYWSLHYMRVTIYKETSKVLLYTAPASVVFFTQFPGQVRFCDQGGTRATPPHSGTISLAGMAQPERDDVLLSCFAAAFHQAVFNFIPAVR
jgi:hypothetical protein